MLHRTWRVRATPERVVEATRPEWTPRLHPLVTHISGLVASVDDHACRATYTVHERVPVGRWSIPNTYIVHHRANLHTGEIDMTAEAALGVRVRHHLRLQPDGDAVVVDHRVDIEAPWPLRAWVTATAAAAHDDWVARLIRHAESSK